MKQLWCEGDETSPDAPMLRAILRGLPVEVRPSRSRGALGGNLTGSIAALRDGDFPDDLAHWRPDPTPQRWEEGGVVRGWRWRRKEIENYLLEPVVLARAFRWSEAETARYEGLLAELLVAVADRTAARMALLGLLPMWERPVVKPFDPALAGEALEQALRERHRRAVGTPRFSEDELVARFRALLPLLRFGGVGHHPWVMAGKDLMGAIARVRGIRERFPALVVPAEVERAVLGAMAADADCADWLPEWAGLRREVEVWAT